MTLQEIQFLQKITGVKGYVDGMKAVEPGYFYDNIGEFAQLKAEQARLGANSRQVEEILLYLGDDIITRKKREQELSPEEIAFYKKIVGINSYIRETKTNNPNWIFDNMGEVEILLGELTKLNTQDPYILAIMHTITTEILKKITQLLGPEESIQSVAEYQARLTQLGIKPLQQKDKSKK
ncbi:MAG: hypothetical protein PHD02_01275 [Bacilli bacterium]|nr:hypothetical protein [Bacilli bacterium]